MTRTTIDPHAPGDPTVIVEILPHDIVCFEGGVRLWLWANNGLPWANMSAPHAAAIGRALIDAARQQEADAMVAEAKP